MESTWQLQEAQDQLEVVVDRAIAGEVQTITRDGEQAVMVVSVAEFEKMKGGKESLVKFFADLNLHEGDLHLERDKSPACEVEI